MSRPKEIPLECWAQMSDEVRCEYINMISVEWYRRVGQFWSDEDWMRGLTTNEWPDSPNNQ